MQNALIDENGLVVNVIVLDRNHEWEAPEGFTLVESDEAKIGDRYVGGAFISPPLPPPTAQEAALSNIVAIENTITQRRMREAVLGIDSGWLAERNAEITAIRATM